MTVPSVILFFGIGGLLSVILSVTLPCLVNKNLKHVSVPAYYDNPEEEEIQMETLL